MKKLSYLIIIVLISSLVLTGCSLLSNVGQVPSTEQKGMPFPTAANLVALWHFDEGSGATTVADSCLSGNTGDVVGATTGVFGKLGNALSFDGTDDYVKVPDSASLDVTDYTLEMWVNANNLAKVYPTLLNRRVQSPTIGYYWIWIKGNCIVLTYSDGEIARSAYWYTSFSIGEWYHIALTKFGSSFTMYKNGSSLGTRSLNYQDAVGGDLFIGTYQGKTGNYPFDGTIDEVRIWDGALTADEILYSYADETLHVDDYWDQWPGAYRTINEALAVADDGDTIIVHKGTYTDDIWDSSLGVPAGYRITKSVTLLGAQAGVDPQGSTNRGNESILVRTNGLPYSITAPNVVIDGFMNGDPSIADSGGRFIIGDDADNVIIRNCIIQNTPVGSSGHGVFIYSGAERATILYNTFYNTAWEAIASWQASDVVISHNYISSSGQHAIQMQGHAGSNNKITYNHISNITGKNAIQYWGGPGATISHNVIVGEGTMCDGIWLDKDADGSTVSYNQISDTIYAGINIRGNCTGATVTYNDISGCGTGIETHAGDITGVSVNYNNIAGNSWGVSNYDTGILNATNNWWGHPSGPSGPGGRPNSAGKIIGKGDAVSLKVGWNPWLSQPIVPLKIANKWDLKGSFVAHTGYNWGGDLAEGATWEYSIHIKEAISGEFSVGSIHFTSGDIEVIGIVEQTKSDYAYWPTPNLAAAGRAKYGGVDYNFLFLYDEDKMWFALSQSDLEPSWTQETIWSEDSIEYQLQGMVQ
jgi:hypothetical protein